VRKSPILEAMNNMPDESLELPKRRSKKWLEKSESSVPNDVNALNIFENSENQINNSANPYFSPEENEQNQMNKEMKEPQIQK
jgi:hypothetical protein